MRKQFLQKRRNIVLKSGKYGINAEYIYINPFGEFYGSKTGKSIEELVMDGMHNKMAMINEESQEKLQDTMQKIVNDSNGGLVCIII